MDIEEKKAKEITYVFTMDEVLQALYDQFLRNDPHHKEMERRRLDNYTMLVETDEGYTALIAARITVHYSDEEIK